MNQRLSRLCCLLLLLCAATAASAAESVNTLAQRLQEEFRPIGSAALPFGGEEADILKRMESGGGSEVFFPNAQLPALQPLQTVSGKPFAASRAVLATDVPGKYWDRSFRILSAQPVRKGDTLLAVFWARGVKKPQIVDDGAGATLQAFFHSPLGNYPKNRVSNFYDCKMLSAEWERYLVKTDPLKVDIPAGKLAFTGMVGHKEQTVEIGGLMILAFPEGSDLTKLPRPSWNYEGRAADAPWRKEAERRIDSIRKNDLVIRVTDAQGKPVPNAPISVTMQKLDFVLGVAVRAGDFAGANKAMTPEDVKQYRALTSKHYNSIVLENDLKWVMFEGARKSGWKNAKECMDFYKKQGKWIRGHVLVWPTVYRAPESLKKPFADTEALRKGVIDHINEEVNEFKEWVDEWDVTNETDVNRDFMDRLGPQAMLDWYRAARTADPKAILTFTEPGFGPAGMEIGSFPKQLLKPDCRGWVDYLVRSGAPLDLLGSQCHGGKVGMPYEGASGPEGLWKYYDAQYAYYGKKLAYTELDVGIGDADDPDQLAYQADILRDTILIAFAHPAFTGVTQWGFWAGSHYAPNAALWRKDWSARPVAQAYLDLLARLRTDAQLTTGADGTCTVRAFYGTYRIQSGDNTATFALTKSNRAITLTRP